MKRATTLEDLSTVLLDNLGRIASHSGEQLKEIKMEADPKKRVLDLYRFVQYIERMDFEMRAYINEYIERQNAATDDEINQQVKLDVGIITRKPWNENIDEPF